MIEEIEIAQLDPRQIKQLETADKALKSDPDYSCEIYSAILKQSPGCLELRKRLRQHQLKNVAKSTKGLGSIIGKVTTAPFMFRAKTDKDPQKSLETSESIIAKNPGNSMAHEMLANSAHALGMHGTVVFALETIIKFQPKDIAILKKLAHAYLEAGDPDSVILTGNKILEINPGDGDAEDLMKKASVAVAMNQGRWEGSTDFRDQLKDKEEAASLEQSAKAVTDKKSLEELINKTYMLIQEEPENLSNYRQLSDYYHRIGDLQNAIAWIKQARTLDAGKGDVSLEEKERQLTLTYYDDLIEQWENALTADPQNEETLSGLNKVRASRQLYQKSQLESLVQRYPNDFGYRFELGCLLFEENSFDECLPHFQLAQRNAKVRLDAILYLGRSYSRKKFYDLAIEQFNVLKSEIQIMDDRKKEAIYELGCCFEQMGKTEKAIEEFKLIYSADISFRDVAEKINLYYSGSQS
jgi:tetratricopeptide (TPR) repeat protein